MKELPNSGGLLVPDDFNSGAVDEVRRIMGRYSASHAGPWRSFAAAWNALAYRYRAAYEYDQEFNEAMQAGDAPPAEERYRQERTLFAFFSAGLSAIECYCFAGYCVGSIAKPEAFPMTKDRDLRFYPSDVAKLFGSEFPGEHITRSLNELVNGPEFSRLSDWRNVLSHRGMFPRSIHMSLGSPAVKTGAYVASNPKSLSSNWQFDQTVDADLTLTVRKWLTRTLDDSLDSICIFVRQHLDKGATPSSNS